jgi:hypothetical protein
LILAQKSHGIFPIISLIRRLCSVIKKITVFHVQLKGEQTFFFQSGFSIFPVEEMKTTHDLENQKKKV